MSCAIFVRTWHVQQTMSLTRTKYALSGGPIVEWESEKRTKNKIRTREVHFFVLSYVLLQPKSTNLRQFTSSPCCGWHTNQRTTRTGTAPKHDNRNRYFWHWTWRSSDREQYIICVNILKKVRGESRGSAILYNFSCSVVDCSTFQSFN